MAEEKIKHSAEKYTFFASVFKRTRPLVTLQKHQFLPLKKDGSKGVHQDFFLKVNKKCISKQDIYLFKNPIFTLFTHF